MRGRNKWIQSNLPEQDAVSYRQKVPSMPACVLLEGGEEFMLEINHGALFWNSKKK